jgi:hypothetical protein
MNPAAGTFERRDPLSCDVITNAPASTVDDAVAVAEMAAAALAVAPGSMSLPICVGSPSATSLTVIPSDFEA